LLSPSTREEVQDPSIEPMNPDDVISDAGFLVDPTVESLRETLDAALGGTCSPTSTVDRTEQYDWDRVTGQAENAYQRAIDGTW
jgi:hypothetical protein